MNKLNNKLSEKDNDWIKNYKLQNPIMTLKNINFRNYNQHNRNFFFKNGIKLCFRNTHKVDIVLSLLQNLRYYNNIKEN